MIERATTTRPRCAGSPTLFFSDRDQDIRRALQLCGQCPLRRPCGESAVARGERYGIWGGMSELEIRKAVERRSGEAFGGPPAELKAAS